MANSCIIGLFQFFQISHSYLKLIRDNRTKCNWKPIDLMSVEPCDKLLLMPGLAWMVTKIVKGCDSNTTWNQTFWLSNNNNRKAIFLHFQIVVLLKRDFKNTNWDQLSLGKDLWIVHSISNRGMLQAAHWPTKCVCSSESTYLGVRLSLENCVIGN